MLQIVFNMVAESEVAMSKLEEWVNGVLLTRARVREVEDLGAHFRRVALQADGAHATRFRVGDKVQVRVGPWTMRTFTPFALAAAPAPMQLLVFHHAPSPAGRWARALQVGASVELFGPRKSLPLEELGAATLFGDETSVAAALAMRAAFLETDHELELRHVLERLGASAITPIARSPGDAHLRPLGERLLASSGPLVLTGKAQSIQALRSQLGPERRRVAKTKAYWAVGKSGLD